MKLWALVVAAALQIADAGLTTTSKASTTKSKVKSQGSSTSCSTTTSPTKSSSTKTTSNPSTSTTPSKCGTDNCLQIVSDFPYLAPEASLFCSIFIHATPSTSTSSVTTTEISTVTVTGPSFSTTSTSVSATTSTPPTLTATVTKQATASVTVTAGSICTADTTLSSTVTTNLLGLSTSMDYKSRAATPPTRKRRDTDIRELCNSGCEQATTPFTARLSSACSCYLGVSTSSASVVTTTATVHATVTATHPGFSTTATTVDQTTVILPQQTSTATTTSTSISTVTVTQCTSTVTNTHQATVLQSNYVCGQTFTATPTASTSGTVTCANAGVASPSANAIERIEGLQSGEGTIFEGCVLSSPRNITTPSGGTHKCDGTNDGANATPFSTSIDMIDVASQLNGFTYDGTYSAEFDDFFIQRIAETTQSGDDYWGVLINEQFTAAGGCETEVFPGQTNQWIFNAFNVNGFLVVNPGFATAQAGQGSITVQVTATDGSGNQLGNQAGATIAGQTTNSNGQVTIPIPATPGCYQYKAQKNGYAISNAFYLTVVAAFGV